MRILVLLLCTLGIGIGAAAQPHSVAREWSELLLEAIRNDFARPPVHARNLYHTSVVMYDAWAAYDPQARPYFLGRTLGNFTCPFEGVPTPTDVQAAREEAISFACYRLLSYRFAFSPGASASLANFAGFMASRGYDINYFDTNYTTGPPAALGNYLAEQIIEFGLQDGSNEQFFFNNLYYQPVNPPLVMDFSGNPSLEDPNRWQPLTLSVFIDQSGNVIPGNTPAFQSPEWGNVLPFALTEDDRTDYSRGGNTFRVYLDPGPPPLLDTIDGSGSSFDYQWGFALVSAWGAHLDPTDGVLWDISPASIGNSPDLPTTFPDYRNFYDLLEGGTPNGGHAINPHTGQPYTPQLVPRGDYTRVLAEFWADGPRSETPPGHWFAILNYVNDHPEQVNRFRGQGPVLDELEWDVKAYLSLGGAMHDAAIAAWSIKGWYDYVRPVSAIRGMAEYGQSTNPNLPSFHPAGLPLIPGRIELVEAGDPLAGPANQHLGKIKLYTWRGPDYILDPTTDVGGVGWILAQDWWPYQRPTFVTPPFAGYISGHSTYSRAAAEVLTAITGDPYFPGGLGEFPAPANDFLVFEQGPSVDLTLQWATYRDASDQTSLSRIWGGIHPPCDDIPGRFIGAVVGTTAVDQAETFFYRDEDGDGFFSYQDCDDLNPLVYPGAPEICDGLDNDCNNLVDDNLPSFTYYRDNDNDGFGAVALALDTCLATPPAGYVSNAGDCNDQQPNINPGAPEICDGLDNDCNNLIDDNLPSFTYYRDNDNDGFGNEALALDTCQATPPAGYVASAGDCNDLNPAINPGAPETCDGLDNNCNNLIDDNLPSFTYYRDNDNDGFGNEALALDTCQATPPAGYVASAGDCNDLNPAINPAASEICDGIDNNCNNLVDDNLPSFTYYRDNDNDGFGDGGLALNTCQATPPAGYVASAGDCNDLNPAINPAASETCDGLDNNCNNLVDDNLPSFTYYRDNDNDGFGDEALALDTCQATPPAGYVANANDCNDSAAGINPTAVDLPDNQVDEDCSGTDLFLAVKLFPNPVRDLLTVHYPHQGAARLRIYHLSGQLLRDDPVALTDNRTQVDCGGLAPGVYVLWLGSTGGEAWLRTKFVKM